MERWFTLGSRERDQQMPEPKTNSPIPPPTSQQDPNWAKKVQKAKQAREAGKQARVGKSPVFRTR